MKRMSTKQRMLDVKRSLIHRKNLKPGHKKSRIKKSKLKVKSLSFAAKQRKSWLKKECKNGLKYTLNRKKGIVLFLPKVMNFSEHYERTVQYITAIRVLSLRFGVKNRCYSLVSVNFDNLEKVSTSAALTLTAELSKWDDAARQQIVPKIKNWNQNIIQQFNELGFFELFNNNPLQDYKLQDNNHLKLVKYIKGRCGDSKKTRLLSDSVRSIVGEKIDKWAFLKTGLDEAITNVSHHAYPKNMKVSEDDRNWYLTGSYNKETNELKIVFYDQGIGIPKSLPVSKFKERLVSVFSGVSSRLEQVKHGILLKAAVEMSRSSTGEYDRGAGLPDLKEFVKERDEGYLSIISLKGLYKYTRQNGSEDVKSNNFTRELMGTLIIWSVTLN
jgi:hypothetical protein